MKTKYSFLIVLFFTLVMSTRGQRVENFTLKDALSGNDFSLESYGESKAIVLIFTSLNCPFSKLYEERIVSLHERFASEGFTFALVNPQVGLEADENQPEMKARAKEKKILFPFLEDPNQEVANGFEITKLPEVVVIMPSPTGFAVAYRGAIDNNPQLASSANLKYLENALVAIQNRKMPSPASSRPVGCNFKLH